jgi:DNA-binding FadR family transcriptional regulator
VTTIPRLSLADATADQLERRIAGGEWPVGSRLPAEPELMALGVGRSTVREAIRTLARVGLVQVRQGDGTYVTARPVDTESLQHRCHRAQLHEIHDVREALELQAARLAAGRRSADDLLALRALLDARAAAAAARDAAAYADADVAFHQRIVVATQNTMLVDLYRVIGDTLVHSLTLRKRESAFDDLDTSAEHEAVLAAIAVGDGDAAAQAVAALFRRGGPVTRVIAVHEATP